MKKISDVVDNEGFKNTKFNTLKTKVNNLENEIPDATTLIHINQYKADKKIEKELEMLIKITIYELFWNILNTKISEVENKIPDQAKYKTIHEFNKLTAENFTARLKQADLVSKTDFDNKLTSFNKWN